MLLNVLQSSIRLLVGKFCSINYIICKVMKCILVTFLQYFEVVIFYI